MNIVIKPHSFVDIITNSSTVIYTYVNSIQAVKDVMNAVLAGIDGCTVTADELFDFQEVLADSVYENYADDILDGGDEDNPHYQVLKDIYDDPDLSWSGKEKAVKEYLVDRLDADEIGDDYYEFPPETRLLVTPKFDGRHDIGDLLMRVFSHEATQDG